MAGSVRAILETMHVAPETASLALALLRVHE